MLDSFSLLEIREIGKSDENKRGKHKTHTGEKKNSQNTKQCPTVAVSFIASHRSLYILISGSQARCLLCDQCWRWSVRSSSSCHINNLSGCDRGQTQRDVSASHFVPGHEDCVPAGKVNKQVPNVAGLSPTGLGSKVPLCICSAPIFW